MTIAAFTTVLTGIIGIPYGAQMIDLGTVFAKIYREYVDNNPSTKYGSYKASSYTAKSGTGFIDNNYGYNYMYKCTFYLVPNYGQPENAVKQTLFEMITNY